MKKLDKILLALAVLVVFAVQPLAMAAGESSRLGTEAAPLAVGKNAPQVFWTIGPEQIDVYSADTSRKLLLTIPYDPHYIPLADRDRLLVEDMNFDGYADLKMMTSRGLANVYYNCWLWDQAKQTFILHEELSQITSPRFDAATKTIFSFNRSNATDSTEATYMFQDGKLRLLEILERAYEKAGNVIITRKYRVDKQGARQLIYEQSVPADR